MTTHLDQSTERAYLSDRLSALASIERTTVPMTERAVGQSVSPMDLHRRALDILASIPSGDDHGPDRTDWVHYVTERGTVLNPMERNYLVDRDNANGAVDALASFDTVRSLVEPSAEDADPATRYAMLTDGASWVGGFSVTYGTGDAHVNAQARYADGFRSVYRGEYLSAFVLDRADGTYWVDEASARDENTRRNRAAAAKRATSNRKRAGRVTAPCIELNETDRNGEIISLPCEDKYMAARVHAAGKARTRCLARIRKVQQRERDAQAANAYDTLAEDAAKVASAVATNATSWDVDH